MAAAIGIAGAGFLAGRASDPGFDQPDKLPASVQPVSPPAPEPPSVLERRDIIRAAQLAADAYAAGRPQPGEVTGLAGRRFALVIPFGCEGPAADDSTAALRWRYDPAQETLRIHAARLNWEAADWGIDDPVLGAGRGEGFWIDRPWTSAETCPPPSTSVSPDGTSPVSTPAPSLALVQFSPSEGDERQARGRSFELVKRMPPDQFDPAAGFRLEVVGRIRPLPGRPPVLCTQAGGGEQRPVCALTVTFEEIAIDAISSGERLGTWSLVQAGDGGR